MSTSVSVEANPVVPPDAPRRRRLRLPALEYVFLVIALTWGVAQVFVVPPLQVPDEGDHWFRAWAITDGQLIADEQGKVTLPASFARLADLYLWLIREVGLPVSLEGQPGFTSYEDLFNGAGPPGEVKVVSRVASYGPVGYLPQAVGVGIGRLVGAPPLAAFYLARLANLLASVALVFLAIRLAPFAKQLFLLAALLPMTMYEFASVSCDALTIAGALLFIATALWASRRTALRVVDVVLILTAAALLLNVKPGYWAIVLLVLLVRPAQLGGRARYSAFVAGAVLLVAGVALLTFLVTSAETRAQVAGGPRVQLEFMAQQPLAFAGILWSNIERYGVGWILSTIGALGWLSIRLSPMFYLIVIVIGSEFFFRMPEAVDLRRSERALLAGTGAAVFLTMAVALYLFLEPMGSDRVFIQGRYLAPVGLLLLLSAYGLWFVQRRIWAPLVVGALVVIMAETLRTLVAAYYF